MDWPGVTFGDAKVAGARHLRVGLTKPVKIGSLLVRGGGRPCVLKSAAAYPGALADDSQWTPAERIGGAPAGREDYALWTLPPGTE